MLSALIPSSYRVAAEIPDFLLSRIGFQVYEGACNGSKVRVHRDDLVERGTYPANRRQKRVARWMVIIDGIERGSASSFKDARAMAFDLCVTTSQADFRIVADFHHRADGIAVLDSEGEAYTTYLENVKLGDQVRVLNDVTAESEDGTVDISKNSLGLVQAIDLNAATLTVFITSTQHDTHTLSVKRRSVTLPTRELALIVSSDLT